MASANLNLRTFGERAIEQFVVSRQCSTEACQAMRREAN